MLLGSSNLQRAANTAASKGRVAFMTQLALMHYRHVLQRFTFAALVSYFVKTSISLMDGTISESNAAMALTKCCALGSSAKYASQTDEFTTFTACLHHV